MSVLLVLAASGAPPGHAHGGGSLAVVDLDLRPCPRPALAGQEPKGSRPRAVLGRAAGMTFVTALSFMAAPSL